MADLFAPFINSPASYGSDLRLDPLLSQRGNAVIGFILTFPTEGHAIPTSIAEQSGAMQSMVLPSKSINKVKEWVDF